MCLQKQCMARGRLGNEHATPLNFSIRLEVGLEKPITDVELENGQSPRARSKALKPYSL